MRTFVTLAGVALAFALGTVLTPTVPAQVPPSKIGFVNALRVLSEIPGGQEVIDFQQESQRRLDQIQAEVVQLQALQNSGLATAQQQQRLSDLQQVARDEQARLNRELAMIRDPLEETIRNAINSIGREQGFTIIFDTLFVLANRNEIVFVDPNAEITTAVIDFINANR